ncbi:uncharacterized protein LOC107982175 [Nasonia vitripennis]|uniref:NADH dehydrogenase [ubiquinone] 1 alpha subcomplex subunit 1 n=1 Tax=Nasonia vitripennis TaxID=7425 RepID=A0A7M7IW83_NASVI|nr:uncharacterized protein LOC107982175 [Nasonia vitripennis]
MWYEALPPLLIIGTLMYSYQITSTLITKAMFGNPYRRLTHDSWMRQMIHRDQMMAGDCFTQVGPETLPDE